MDSRCLRLRRGEGWVGADAKLEEAPIGLEFRIRFLHSYRIVILCGASRVLCEMRSRRTPDAERDANVYGALCVRRTPRTSVLPMLLEPFHLNVRGGVASILVEKVRNVSARRNASGSFDCVARKVRELLRSG